MSCIRRRRVIVSSTSFDAEGSVIGSGPVRGERNQTGVVIPPDPTVDQAHRYLALLCAFAVPEGATATILSLRQLVYVGWDRPAQNDRAPEGVTVPIELPFSILGPLARFVDGNVSWHLRKLPTTMHTNVGPQAYPLSWNRNFNDLTPGMRFDRLPVSMGGEGYNPPNGGYPPGEPIHPFGEWHDVRYPWVGQSGSLPELNIEVEGPCQVHWYVSVHQTDPATRPAPIPPIQAVTDYASLISEGILLARYKRIAGEIVADIRPDNEDERLP